MEGEGQVQGAPEPGPPGRPIHDMDVSEAEANLEDEGNWQAQDLQEELGWDSAWGDDPVAADELKELQDKSEGAVSGSRYCNCTPTCPRRGQEEESSFHQLWACKANKDIPGAR